MSLFARLRGFLSSEYLRLGSVHIVSSSLLLLIYAHVPHLPDSRVSSREAYQQ